MEHLQVWWGNVHIARGYLSLQRISPCHLFQYRLHVTLIFFSCEPGTNLRPPVLSDEGALSAIHTDLAEKELLPEQHLVDAGYVTIAHLVQSQSSYEVDLVGPTLKTHWYQAETGYDLTHFDIDWEAETVTCPEGRSSSSWTPVQDAGKSLMKVKFSQSDCKVCPARTRSEERRVGK